MTILQLIKSAALATVISIAVVGCQSQPKAKPVNQQAIPSAEQTSPGDGEKPRAEWPKVDQMDASAGSVEALTWKAEAYTKELAPLMAARQVSPPRTPQLPTLPSHVEWMDPNGLTLDSYSSSRGPGVTIRPVIDPTPRPINAAPPVVPLAAAQADAQTPAQSRPAPAADNAVAMVSESLPQPVEGSRAKPARSGSSAIADALSEKFSRRVKDYPRDVSAQLEYQLLQFLNDEPTPQLPVLSSLPPEDRELVTTVLDGLTNFRNALRADNNMLLSNKIKPLLDMSERLRSQADLTIPNIALCKSVGGYGIYEPIDPARFAVGRDEQAIVYCEIANFLSTLNDKQQWETRLTWDMTLYAEQGMSVWSDKTENVIDNCRDRRHDFFVRKAITLPKTLPIGRYLLKVSIVDTQSNRVAEATIPLVIAVP